MDTAKMHTGGCHCGKVRYEVKIALDKVMACNCSICSKKAPLMAFVAADDFRLLQGEADVTDYVWNKQVVHHKFCKTCGIHSFGHGVGPGGKAMCMVNVRCLDDVDTGPLPVTHFDGKSL